MSLVISKLQMHVSLVYKDEIVPASVSAVQEMIQANLLPEMKENNVQQVYFLSVYY